MDLLKKSAEIYTDYVDYDYTFTVDCGFSITVAFRARYFYHLVGLQYLTDIAQLDKTRQNNSAAGIYKKILNGRITHDLIRKSEFYNMIDERLSHFIDLGDVICSKLIVDFDYTNARYIRIRPIKIGAPAADAYWEYRMQLAELELYAQILWEKMLHRMLKA